MQNLGQGLVVPVNFLFFQYVAQYTLQRLIFENKLGPYSQTSLMENIFSDRNIKIEYKKKKNIGQIFDLGP